MNQKERAAAAKKKKKIMMNVKIKLIENAILYGQGERPFKPLGRPSTKPLSHYISVILKVCKTGCQWNSLDSEELSYSSYYSKFRTWTKAGIFEKAHNVLCKILQLMNLIGNVFVIDSCSILNKHGYRNDCIGFTYKYKGKRATKLTLICDRIGIPVGLYLSGANVHDKRLVIPAFDTIGPELKAQIKLLLGDKGYIDKEFKKQFQQEGVVYLCNARKNAKIPNTPLETKILQSDRVVVEHCFSWLKSNKRLGYRYERTLASFMSFVYISCINVIINKTIP